jgi:hypothetical protein
LAATSPHSFAVAVCYACIWVADANVIRFAQNYLKDIFLH